VLWTDVCSRAQVTRALHIGTAYGPTHLARLVSWARRHRHTLSLLSPKTLVLLSKDGGTRFYLQGLLHLKKHFVFQEV
jgi:hypothetical protein